MKIVMIGSYPFNKETGPSMHIKNISKHLKEKKELELFIISEGNNNKLFIINNVNVLTIKKDKFYPLNEISFSIKIKKMIDKINPDIVHFHVVSPYSFFIFNNKKIFTLHGLFYHEVKYRFKGIKFLIQGIPRIISEFIILKTEKYFISVSDYIKRSALKHTKGIIHTIPNGIDEKLFTYTFDKKETHHNAILYVANIEPRKGLFMLVKSINKVKNAFPDISLIVVGKVVDKQYFDNIVNYINSNNIKKNVIFRGYINRNELFMEYSKCSIFVLPSLIEPFGIVILEAMAFKKPVIASNTGGIPSIITNGYNGLLFDGSIQDLSNKIIYLLNNNKIREYISQNGYVTANDYKWSKIAEITYQYYKQIEKDLHG